MAKQSKPMPAAEFKAGDVVKLKGSPLKMTVEWVNDKLGYAGCVWAQGSKVHREKLALHTLDKAAS